MESLKTQECLAVHQPKDEEFATKNWGNTEDFTTKDGEIWKHEEFLIFFTYEKLPKGEDLSLKHD